jgi:hypothetical protein
LLTLAGERDRSYADRIGLTATCVPLTTNRMLSSGGGTGKLLSNQAFVSSSEARGRRAAGESARGIAKSETRGAFV